MSTSETEENQGGRSRRAGRGGGRDARRAKRGGTGSVKLPYIQRKLKPFEVFDDCLLYTSPSPRDQRGSRMPSSA